MKPTVILNAAAMIASLAIMDVAPIIGPIFFVANAAIVITELNKKRPTGPLKLMLTPLDVLKIIIFGHVKTAMRIHEGWSGPMQFYAFHCPTHGIVESRTHGYDEYLYCPLCNYNEAK